MTENVNRIQPISELVIQSLEAVERICNRQLHQRQDPEWSGSRNDQSAILHLGSTLSSRTVSANLMQLVKEPFVAYVKAEEEGRERVLLVCRNYIPPSDDTMPSGVEFVSRNAPVGRASAIQVGESIRYAAGGKPKELRVLEKHTFRPQRETGWDAVNNAFFFDNGEFSVSSLLAWLASEGEDIPSAVAATAGEELRRMEEEEMETLGELSRIREGRRREVVESLQLRDQAILDSDQDELFRLPLSSQFVLTGGPGTGKTTVLIQRISLKTKAAFLLPDEIAAVTDKGLSRDSLRDLLEGPMGWLLFTPSDLLKVYLREALNREGIPASDQRIQTWQTYRYSLSRPECYGLLQVGRRRGPFRHSTESLLSVSDNAGLIVYGEAFQRYLRSDLVVRIEESAVALADDPSASDLLRAIKGGVASLKRGSPEAFDSALIVVLRRLARWRDHYNQNAKAVREDLSDLASKVLSHDQVLDQIHELLQSQDVARRVAEVEPADGEDDDDDEELDDVDVDSIALSQLVGAGSESLVRAKQAVMSALRTIARSRITGRRIPSGQSPMVAVLEPFLPSSEDLEAIGRGVVTQTHAQRWTRGVDLLLRHIPQAYGRFRRSQLRNDEASVLEGMEGKIRANLIGPDELDLLLFVLTRLAREALKAGSGALDGDTRSRLLERTKEHLYGQVVVDEVTDFSSHQLGTMYHLSHPSVGDLSMAGDLMQRVEARGLQEWEQLSTAIPDAAVRELHTTYRQSGRLLEIARELATDSTGVAPTFASAYGPSHAMPPPLILKHHGDGVRQGEWVVERILEIYAVQNSLPSIAVCVPDESAIDAAYEQIASGLMAEGIEAEKCPDGKIGDGHRVRVFSVDYLKGLEFEGVFLLDVDQIEGQRPDLVDKFIYVAVTRAATYLGLTVNTSVPRCLRSVEHEFEVSDWSDYSAAAG